MAVYQELIHLDTMYQQLRTAPVIINDMANITETDKQLVADTISTSYTGDMITMLPSCRCGHTKGEVYIGDKCERCHEPVASSIEDDVEPIVWFRRPNGVAPLLNITVWTWLKQRFTKSGFSLLQWLTDPRYRPNIKQPPIVEKLIEAGFTRGYNNFYENFDNIMAFLFSLKDFKPKKERGTRDYLQEILEKERHKLFSDYIPLPNKTFLLIEKTNMGIFIDPIVINAMDAITMLVSIDKNFYDQDNGTKQNRTARALNALSEFHKKYMRSNLCPKPGQFRRHVYGTRTNFSFRAVITSIEGPCQYDEIHVPWGIGLTAHRPHVISKLLNRGYDLNSAIGLFMSNINSFNPTLGEVLDELIVESGNGLVSKFQRNLQDITSIGFLH